MTFAQPLLCNSPAQLKEAMAGVPFVLVPTMGALHEGHIWLVEQAKRTNRPVVVSIFVNPLQFDNQEDLRTYPRTLKEDLQRLTGVARAVYVPSVEQMYPKGIQNIGLNPGPIGKILEGKSRPGFFEGVLQVVAKLLNQTLPYEVFFSKKDAQQAFLVKRMIKELDFSARVRVTGFLREESGLPYSSRNRRLSLSELCLAAKLSQTLLALAQGPMKTVGEYCQSVADNAAGLKLDYVAVVDKNFSLLTPEHMVTGPALLLAAAGIGNTRVIDNVDLGGYFPI